MNNRLITFDVETTGKDVAQDQIIEFSIHFDLSLHQDGRVWRFKPTIPISPGAKEVHGISMKDLRDCPTFAEGSQEIIEILNDYDVWVGYNIKFDINMLQAELRRNNLTEFDLKDKIVIDPFKIWQFKEPRTLSDAYRRFVGKELEGAHSAGVDTRATSEVLVGMLQHYGMLDVSLENLALFCEPEKSIWIGHSNHIKWGEEGTPVINFGKHAEKSLIDLANNNPGFLNWIKTKDFPVHVRDIVEQALMYADDEDEFINWITSKYGEPLQIDG